MFSLWKRYLREDMRAVCKSLRGWAAREKRESRDEDMEQRLEVAARQV